MKYCFSFDLPLNLYSICANAVCTCMTTRNRFLPAKFVIGPIFSFYSSCLSSFLFSPTFLVRTTFLGEAKNKTSHMLAARMQPLVCAKGSTR